MIKYSIRGENLEVTEALRDYVVSKLEKIEKYFQADQELDARVNLKVYREKTAKVEVTIPLGSITLASCLQMLSLKKRKLHLQKSFAPNKLT